MKGQQLPLAVHLRETASYDSFFPGPNSEALHTLRTGTSDLLLFGPSASGKTHLLQGCARASGAAYLPMRECVAHGAEALQGYEPVSALCIDDIDAVTGTREWCVALMRLIDSMRARQARLAISAAAPPERTTFAVPDLRTRLTACAVFGLRALDDPERAQLLQQRALARGLDLGDDVAAWLLTRLSRDTGALLAALDQLDRAALTAKRRLTLPFVQSVLAGSA